MSIFDQNRNVSTRRTANSFLIEAEDEPRDSYSQIKLDMYESESDYVILFDCAGYPKEDIRLNWHGNQLRIKLVSNDNEYEQNGEFSKIVSELIDDDEERLIDFEEPIKKESVHAEYHNGLLTVRVKKLLEDDDDALIQIAG